MNDKLNDLKIMPCEQFKDFYSSVDSVISEFQIKCEILKTDAEIFSRVEAQIPFHIMKEIIMDCYYGARVVVIIT